MKKGAFVATPQAAAFHYGQGHPFSPRRAVDAYELFDRYGLLDPDQIAVIAPEDARREDLLLAVSEAYLDSLVRADSGDPLPDAARWGLGTPDCPIFKGLFRYASLAVGAGCAALTEVLKGRSRCAFNPTGGFHHAYHDHAEGFCYINDVVVLLRKVRQKGLRPAFVDLDAHYPNGVAAAFLTDPEVLVLSLHENPRTLYPYQGYVHEKGSGEGEGTTVNVVLEPGTDDEIFTEIFSEIVPQALSLFEPDILLLELGMDTLSADPLAHLNLSTNALAEAARVLRSFGLPVVALGGGGYSVSHTVRGWTRVWAELIHRSPHDSFAGVVGGMMFGPETEAGRLYDETSIITGETKERLRRRAAETVKAVKESVFPSLERACRRKKTR